MKVFKSESRDPHPQLILQKSWVCFSSGHEDVAIWLEHKRKGCAHFLLHEPHDLRRAQRLAPPEKGKINFLKGKNSVFFPQALSRDHIDHPQSCAHGSKQVIVP
ncbi:hypothetical protein Q8A67_022858 [Cirrhinus molitorella]|uniref:Uncharacterized protein n=1 Tax=Cirrhinus molitorella TaxID=172907 RepID=A0AA88P2J6_9TELE|nr:hypothetical protein Q8A67_022858 [Cirrhinus molitorella]